jgi:PKD repeat protein
LISGLTVTFDASASTGATSYSWNFGTGVRSQAERLHSLL